MSVAAVKSRRTSKTKSKTAVKKSTPTKKASPLQEGSRAPLFSLPDKDDVLHNLKDQKGKKVVIFFYPKDNTPGCTIEARQIDATLKRFKSLDVSVFGISGGDAKTKKKFCAQQNLTVPLLSDTDFKVADAYGVYGEKSFMGRTYMGISRCTFVLNEKGTIEKVFTDVKPEEHADELLHYLK